MKIKRPGVRVRCKCEYLGGTRFRCTCPQGHVQIADVSKHPKPTQRLGETQAKLLSKHWVHNGVTIECKGCTKVRDEAHARPRIQSPAR